VIRFCRTGRLPRAEAEAKLGVAEIMRMIFSERLTDKRGGKDDDDQLSSTVI